MISDAAPDPAETHQTWDADIAGAHAPTAHVYYRRALPIGATAYLALGVGIYVFDHHQVQWLTVVLPASWVVMWWANVRAPRTVVQPAGLRVRTGLRWREIPWADVQSVSNPTPWSTATLTVRTPAGEVTLPGLATARGPELLRYAAAHTRP